MEQFFVFIDEKEQGPFTIDQLAMMNITPDTDVWTQGMDDWKPAGDVPALTQLLQQLQEKQGTEAPATDAEVTEVEVMPVVVENSGSQVVVSEPEPEKKDNKPPYVPDEPMGKKAGCFMWGSIVFFILMVAMMFTVPDRKEHLEEICAASNEWVNTTIDQSAIGGRVIGDVAKWVAGCGAELKVKEMFRYKNYFVCSLGYMKYDRVETLVSVGVFGHVFTFSSDEIGVAIKNAMGAQSPLEMATEEPTVGEDPVVVDTATVAGDTVSAAGNDKPKDGKEVVKEAAKEILDSAAEAAKREAIKAGKEWLDKKIKEL